MGIWGNPAATKNFFYSSWGGGAPAPGAPPFLPTPLQTQCSSGQATCSCEKSILFACFAGVHLDYKNEFMLTGSHFCLANCQY